MAQVLETEAIGEGLADWLESEGGVDISQGEPLAIHSADRDSPVLVTVLGQLGDVGGHISLIIVLYPQILQSFYANWQSQLAYTATWGILNVLVKGWNLEGGKVKLRQVDTLFIAKLRRAAPKTLLEGLFNF